MSITFAKEAKTFVDTLLNTHYHPSTQFTRTPLTQAMHFSTIYHHYLELVSKHGIKIVMALQNVKGSLVNPLKVALNDVAMCPETHSILIKWRTTPSRMMPRTSTNSVSQSTTSRMGQIGRSMKFMRGHLQAKLDMFNCLLDIIVIVLPTSGGPWLRSSSFFRYTDSAPENVKNHRYGPKWCQASPHWLVPCLFDHQCDVTQKASWSLRPTHHWCSRHSRITLHDADVNQSEGQPDRLDTSDNTSSRQINIKSALVTSSALLN